MALNFPNNPTIGDTFEDWVWGGSSWLTAQTLPGGLPAGSIIQWGGSTAPANWLLCDGSAVSRTTYASLYAAIGTTYGSGNGSTTFNVPDLRGRVPVGKNGGSFGTLGATGGAESVTLTSAQIPAHTHPNVLTNATVASSDHVHGSTNLLVRLFQGFYQARSGASWTASNSNNYSIPGGSSSSTTQGVAVGGNTDGPSATTTVGITNANNTGGGESHPNVQPYQVVNYIIKATAASTPGDSELATRVQPVTLGGTGTTSLTSGGYLKGNGTSAVTSQAGIPATDLTGTIDVARLPTIPIAKGGTGATTGAGLVKVIPTSISNSAGTASLDATTGEVTFTNVTSIGLNGIFTSAFKHYRIIYVVTGAFTQTQMYRFRTGGTDNANASYYFEEHYANAGAMGASGFNNSATGRIGYSEAGYRSTHVFDVINPYEIQPTELLCNFGKVVSPTICQVIGGFNATTQFDGMNFYLGAGTGGSSGFLKVYGYA